VLKGFGRVWGQPAFDLVLSRRELLEDLARSFNTVPEQLPERIATLRAELKVAEREREKLRDEVRSARVKGGNGLHVKHGRVDYLTETVDAATVDELKAYADRYLELLKSGIVTVVAGDKFVIKVSNDLTPQFDANTLKAYFGRGGGRPQLVSGVLNVPAEEAFKRLEDALK
jgi:alanyl-tRNA synthetase